MCNFTGEWLVSVNSVNSPLEAQQQQKQKTKKRKVLNGLNRRSFQFQISYWSFVRLGKFLMIWRVQTDHILVRKSKCISIFFSLEKEWRADITASESFSWNIWKRFVQSMLVSSECGKVRLHILKGATGPSGAIAILWRKTKQNRICIKQQR